jgi:hypothetical protein
MSPLRALLIGIGDYSPNRLPDGEECPNLEGAVPDVEAVEIFLRERFGLTPENTLKLTAQPGVRPKSPELWPTHDNIVKAFQKLSLDADPGDSVYIHYSGHGARLPTQFPELKGRGGFDEALVPCDICKPGSAYLLDVEFAALMRALVETGLITTLVIDSCHGGGITRGAHMRGPGGNVTRGLKVIGRSPRPLSGAVAPRDELVENWREVTGTYSIAKVTRGIRAQGFLPNPRGYALLAACRPDELANELPFENGERHGALTYWLLRTLEGHGTQLSCKEVHDRVYARVRNDFPRQTPLLFGRERRRFFGSRTATRGLKKAVTVIRFDAERGVLLNAGQSQGIQIGDRFFVRSPRSGSGAVRKIQLEIRQVGAVDSWAVAPESAGASEVEPGDQAELIGPGPQRLVRGVSLERQELASGIDQERALDSVRRELNERSAGFVHLAEDGEASDFYVVVNARNEYEIWDANRGRIPNLPSLPIANDQAIVPKLVRHLEHLAKFQNVWQLRNPAPDPLIADAIELRLAESAHDGSLELCTGESTTLEVVNKSSDTLNVALLHLAPDWSIRQILPKGEYFALDPGVRKTIKLTASLPRGYSEGRDVLKVFATLGPTSFRWLELPAIKEAGLPRVRRGAAPSGPLAEFFAMMASDVPVKRKLMPSECPEEEWISAQVSLLVRASEPGISAVSTSGPPSLRTEHNVR